MPLQTTHIEEKNGERRLVKKPTGFLSSSKCVREQLGVKCKGGHAHMPLVGGRASGAQVYTQALCEAICKGVAMQKEADALIKVSIGRMTEGELKSCVGQSSNMQAWASSSVCRFMSIREGAGDAHVQLVITPSTGRTSGMNSREATTSLEFVHSAGSRCCRRR